MTARWLFRLALLAPAALVVLGVASAFTATNAVPATNAGTVTQAITPDALKPPQCAGITITNLVTGTGSLNGSSGNDLILAGPGADSPKGLNGNDCILGGGGDDSINGGAGTDVCLGGPGNDTFTACETQIQ